MERGRVSREELMGRFSLSAEGFEREFAVLRHCELLRGFKREKLFISRNSDVFIALFNETFYSLMESYKLARHNIKWHIIIN